MENEQPIKQAFLQVETNLDALAEVLQWFEALSLPLLSYDLWWQSQLALTEGFTNAVRHAHRGLPPKTPIQIEVCIFVDYLEMKIWDQGQPFDLETKLRMALNQPLDPFNPGGRGLIFMHKFTNALHYIRAADQRNCLIMRKKIPLD